MFFLGEKRAEVRAALVDESEDGKVAVSEVAKRVGALWKAMDETAKAPYTAMAKAAKEERDAEIAKLMEEASISEQSEESASIDDAEEDDESAGKPVTHAAAAALPAEVVDNEITKIAFQGIDDGSVEEEDDKSVVSGVTQATGLEELDQDDEEDDGLEVEEHVLADGSKVLKSDDGTLYDESSFEEIGKWDEASNSLITA